MLLLLVFSSHFFRHWSRTEDVWLIVMVLPSKPHLAVALFLFTLLTVDERKLSHTGSNVEAAFGCLSQVRSRVNITATCCWYGGVQIVEEEAVLQAVILSRVCRGQADPPGVNLGSLLGVPSRVC